MSHDKNEPELILASKSPRRIELLEMLGVNFKVMPSGIEEDPGDGMPPGQLVEKNALAKAQDVADGLDSESGPRLVIGADTVVVLDGRIFGKPADMDDAGRMLSTLVGKTHEVYSGVAVVRSDGSAKRIAHAITRVTFRPLSDRQIARYLEMIDPLDKAGAYAIQGIGGVIIEKIEGCYYNVVGLPLTVLDDLLAHFDSRLL